MRIPAFNCSEEILSLWVGSTIWLRKEYVTPLTRCIKLIPRLSRVSDFIMVALSSLKAHNPTTKRGLLRIKKTFLASGAAAARNPLRRQKKRTTKYSGWRFGSLVACFEVGICLTINVLFTAFAITSSNPPNGIGTLYEGSCKTVKNLDTWLHVVLNGLATALIGASNYNMQCLASPSRQEIDRAHAKGTWLDIGIPSVRNLRHIERKRVFLWALLATSSLPLHLLWNSAIFSTLQNNGYVVITVRDDFLLNGTFTCGGYSPDVYNGYESIVCDMYKVALGGVDSETSLTRLDYHDCAREYDIAIQSKWSNVLAVLKSSVSQNYSDLSISAEYSLPPLIFVSDNLSPETWTCENIQPIELGDMVDPDMTYGALLETLGTNGMPTFRSSYLLCSDMLRKDRPIKLAWSTTA